MGNFEILLVKGTISMSVSEKVKILHKRNCSSFHFLLLLPTLAIADAFPLRAALVADLLLPAIEATSALLLVVAADLSFIKGIGASETAAS